MIVWSVYAPYPVDRGGRKVTDDAGRPAWDDPSVANLRIRWRVTGFANPRSRSFPATAEGRRDLKAFHRRLAAAAREHWPADDRGRPVSPTDAARAAPAPTPSADPAATAAPAAAPPPAGSPQPGAPPAAFAAAPGGLSPAGATVVGPETMTVEAWVEQWLAIRLPRMNSAKNRSHYDTQLPFAAELLRYPEGDPRGPAGASIPLAELTTADCQRAVDERVSRNRRSRERGSLESPAVSVRTENAFIDALGRLLRDARAHTPPLLDGDPLAGVASRRRSAGNRENRQRQDAATLEEILAVVDELDEHWHAMVLFRAVQACRIGEIRTLDVDDIDLDSRTVTYWRATPQVSSKHNHGSTIEDRGLKHRDPTERRVVPLPDWPRLLDLLAGHLERMRELHRARDRKLSAELDAARDAGRDTARLEHQLEVHRMAVRAFPSKEGAPLDSSNFSARHWHPAVNRALADDPEHPLHGLPFKDVRHAAANDWQDHAGLSARDAAELAGNSEAVMQAHYRRRRRGGRHRPRLPSARQRRVSPRVRTRRPRPARPLSAGGGSPRREGTLGSGAGASGEPSELQAAALGTVPPTPAAELARC